MERRAVVLLLLSGPLDVVSGGLPGGIGRESGKGLRDATEARNHREQFRELRGHAARARKDRVPRNREAVLNASGDDREPVLRLDERAKYQVGDDRERALDVVDDARQPVRDSVYQRVEPVYGA